MTDLHLYFALCCVVALAVVGVALAVGSEPACNTTDSGASPSAAKAAAGRPVTDSRLAPGSSDNK